MKLANEKNMITEEGDVFTGSPITITAPVDLSQISAATSCSPERNNPPVLKPDHTNSGEDHSVR